MGTRSGSNRRKRSKQVSIRLYPEELDHVIRVSNELGISRAEVFRRAFFVYQEGQ